MPAVKFDLANEIRIKIKLRRTDEQIMDDLLKDGFPIDEISNEIRIQRDKNKRSFNWLIQPILISSVSGTLTSVILIIMKMTPFFWALIFGILVMSMLILCRGVMLMARSIQSVQGSGVLLSFFRIQGTISALYDMEQEDKKIWENGFILFGIGLGWFFLGSFLVRMIVQMPRPY